MIWVSPAKIVFYTEIQLAKSKGIFTAGHVWGGDWDLAVRPIVRHPTYKGLREHFVKGLEWERTSLFRTPGFTYLKDAQSVQEKCRARDALYHSIQQRGILPSYEGDEADPFNTGAVKNIIVLIGRSGRIIFGSRGWHRLCIAKILKLPSIPVEVVVRHREWLRIRQRLAAARVSSSLTSHKHRYSGHPDLKVNSQSP